MKKQDPDINAGLPLGPHRLGGRDGCQEVRSTKPTAVPWRASYRFRILHALGSAEDFWYLHGCFSYPGRKSDGRDKNVVGRPCSYRELLHFLNLPNHFLFLPHVWPVFVIARGSWRAWQVDINKGHKGFTSESLEVQWLICNIDWVVMG